MELGGCVSPVCLGWRCVGLLACACVRIAAGPAWCAGSATTGKNPRLFPARIGGPLVRLGGAGARWIAGLACCRCWLPGVVGHAGGYVRIVREGMPGVFGRGLWACRLWWIDCRMHWKSTENLQKKSPEKCPRKKFSKNFPLWGNGLRWEFFCKKGVDICTHGCYALATNGTHECQTKRR